MSDKSLRITLPDGTTKTVNEADTTLTITTETTPEIAGEVAFEAWLKTYDGLCTGALAQLGQEDMREVLRLAFTAGYAMGFDDGQPHR